MTAVLNPEVVGTFTDADYYDQLARLRRDAPVRQYAPNAWTVACYDDVRTVSRDPGAVLLEPGGVAQRSAALRAGAIEGSILHMDPPEHAPWRSLVTPPLHARAVSALEARVRTRRPVGARARCSPARRSTSSMRSRRRSRCSSSRSCSVSSDDDRDKFRRWSDAAIESPDQPGRSAWTISWRCSSSSSRTSDRRREHPTDDIASAVVHAEVDGDPVTTREAVGYLLALLVAGQRDDAPSRVGQRRRARRASRPTRAVGREPARIAGAVEECLRWVTPIQAFGRTATRSTPSSAARRSRKATSSSCSTRRPTATRTRSVRRRVAST